MKKVVRILGFCALMTFAFTACNKNNDGKVAIKVSMPETSSDSKTYLVGNSVKWSGGDQITVFDPSLTEENYLQLTLASGAGQTKATFYGDAGFFDKLDTDSAYMAFYPVNEITGITDNDSVYMVIPTTQTFVENSFSPNTYPMYAKNDHTSHFKFKSPAGLLTIPIKSTEEGIVITSIELTVGSAAGGHHPLVGALKYNQGLTDKNGDNIPDYKVESPIRTVTLACGGTSGYTLPKNVTVEFNIVLLEGALNGSKFTVLLKDGTNATIGGLNGYPTQPLQRQMRITMPTITLPLSDSKLQ